MIFARTFRIENSPIYIDRFRYSISDGVPHPSSTPLLRARGATRGDALGEPACPCCAEHPVPQPDSVLKIRPDSIRIGDSGPRGTDLEDAESVLAASPRSGSPGTVGYRIAGTRSHGC